MSHLSLQGFLTDLTKASDEFEVHFFCTKLLCTCSRQTCSDSSDYIRSEREPSLLPRVPRKGRVMPPNNNTHIGPRCLRSACLWPCVYELGLFWVYSHYILLGEIKWPCLESRCPPDWLLLDSHAHGVGKLMEGFQTSIEGASGGKRKLEKEVKWAVDGREILVGRDEKKKEDRQRLIRLFFFFLFILTTTKKERQREREIGFKPWEDMRTESDRGQMDKQEAMVIQRSSMMHARRD